MGVGSLNDGASGLQNQKVEVKILHGPPILDYNGGIMKRRKKKLKPVYLRVRLPQIPQTGGMHIPEKGGKHHRGKEKDKTRKEVEAELG